MYKPICHFLFAALWALAAQAQQPTQPDHFKCYFAQAYGNTPALPIEITSGLQLQDQFDAAGPETINDLRIVRLCTAVQKIHRNRQTTSNLLHNLLFFELNPQKTVLRRVLVENQFGRQTLTVRSPRILAVPTSLGGIPDPGDLDHYKCYDACGREVNDPVRLRDVFQPDVHTRVLEPALFCNPVKKRHGNTEIGIQRPDVHLTCYTMNVAPFQFEATVLHQFSSEFGVSVKLGSADLLCTPTRKLNWANSDLAIVD